MKKELKPSPENRPLWVYGWRRTALLTTLVLVSIVSQIDRILPFILAESIKADLNLTDTQIGLITGLAFTVCYSLASLPLARISDQGRSRRVLVYCVVIWSIMTSLGGMAIGFVTLALSRIGVALGESGGMPASHAIIAQKIPEQFRGRAIGLFSMGIPVGTMLGFALGGWSSDTIGWRNALFGAGILGIVVVVMVSLFTGKSSVARQYPSNRDGLIKSGLELLSKPAFTWLFIAAVLMGLASSPFYIFTAPFLIRTFEFSASEVGLSFGLLQGAMGIAGTLIGGRMFDRALEKGSPRLFYPPAIVLIMASLTTLTALFIPVGWISIILLVPGMFSFAFLLPYAFGSGHLIAGAGKQALSTSVLMLGSGLLGATISPLVVGWISDLATASHINNGLRIGLLLVPFFSLLTGITGFVVSKKIRPFLSRKPMYRL